MMHLFHKYGKWVPGRYTDHYEYEGAPYPYKTTQVFTRECEKCGWIKRVRREM